MLTQREHRIVEWLRKRKVATMKALRHQFQVSHMTVVRALKKSGYYNSYNHNARYYVLGDVPRFDAWGLWSYRDIHFSVFGSLPATLVVLVEKAKAGLTVEESEQRLQTKTANLLSALVSEARITRQRVVGHQVVYVAQDAEKRTLQLQQRQMLLTTQGASSSTLLPPGCTAIEVIEVLKQMIRCPGENSAQMARKLNRRSIAVTAAMIERIIAHGELKKKRPRHRHDDAIHSRGLDSRDRRGDGLRR